MDQEFLKRLLSTFRIEAEEHIKNISENLLSYEKSSDPNEKQELINTIFRDAHSLKGASRAVNMVDIEGFCQSLESILSEIRDNKISTSYKLIDDIHVGIDLVSSYVNEDDEKKKLEISIQLDKLKDDLLITSSTKEEKSPRVSKRKSVKEKPVPVKEDTIKQVEVEIATESSENSVAPPKISKFETTKLQDTIRVSTKKLDTLFLKSEEMISAKLVLDNLTKQIQGIVSEQYSSNKLWEDLKSRINKSSHLLSNEMLEILDKYDKQISSTSDRSSALYRKAVFNSKVFSNMVSNLIEEMKDVLMLPFSYLTDSFPKMVRELARDLDKKIDFELDGTSIEVDRRILEEMKDALIHLIRNCIDHGIESAEERKTTNKSESGKISLSITKISGDKLEICLADDGAGLNFEAIKKKAISRNLISESDSVNISEKHLIDFLFHHDFSTASTITDISGRGVGMSVVREKVNNLNGSIIVKSEKDKGTKFNIVLPLSLAKIRAVIFGCANQMFALQTLNVDRVFRINNKEIRTIEGRDSITYKNKPIPLCTMSSILGLQTTSIVEKDYSNIIVLNISNNIIAYKVDDIYHEQEILIKKLNRQLEKLHFVNGATVLGDGKIIPVLNSQDLLKFSDGKEHRVIRNKDTRKEQTYKLLIADDSVTSRMLLRDILESVGYSVKMVIDGQEALTELKSNRYDLVISDVEMPRMSGFELTKNIRKDEKLKDTPVILITALAKKEDREQGIDSGANAYIVKSGFDQSNLLDTIKRLV